MLFFCFHFQIFPFHFQVKKWLLEWKMLLGHMLKWLIIKCTTNFVIEKLRKGPGGIHRLKQHLAGIRGQITPCQAPSTQIGVIMELLNSFEKFEQEKARQKEIEAEIGRKRSIQQMMAANPHFDFEGSSYIPCTNASNPFCYVPPTLDSMQEKGKGKMRKKGDMNIKSYFTVTPSSPSDAHGP